VAVTLNNGVAANPGLGTTRTFSYTCGGGSNRLILLQTFTNPDSVTAASYAGGAMTLVDTFGDLRLFGRVAPATGANNISYTLSAYGASRASIANFDGVDQATPLGSVVQNTGSSAAPTSSSITCPAGGLIFSGGRHNYSGGAATAGAGTTLAGSEFSAGASKFAGHRSSSGAAAFVTPGSDVWNLQSVPINPASGGDTTPPVLTSATGTQTGSTTANGGVTTDEGNGTLYGVVSTSPTPPTAAQVRAGQMHTGAAAAYATNGVVSSPGAKVTSATGLTPSTTYYWHFTHRDAALNDSAVASSAGFTTAAASTPKAAFFYTLIGRSSNV
jgi:hypothetical protein